MGPRYRPHKVGLTAALIGLPCILLLPFAVVARSRIQTGSPVATGEALGTAQLAAVIAAWAVLVLLSITGPRSSSMAFGRGVAASACVLVPLALLDVAAPALLSTAGQFGRVSIGAGIWAGGLAAYAVVLASRREIGATTPQAWLIALLMPAGLAALLLTGRLDCLGVVVEYRNIAPRYWSEVLVHVELAGVAIALATLIGVSLGIVARLMPGARRPLFAVVSLFQTIPGLALIGMLVGPFGALANRIPILRDLGVGGLGWAPVVFALTLYGLLPVMRNTFAGLEGVPTAALEAGAGMGMTRPQLLAHVHLPLAAPVVFSGVRTTSEQTVGNTVLGAFAAAGGLGLFVFQGLSQQSTDLIVLGSGGIVVLALVVDALMRVVESAVSGRRRRTGGGG